jgi:DNA-directed RNA polymerase subunit alpha
VVEPLEGGYGVTVGNSLRRVLLSSLTGAAVTRLNSTGASRVFDDSNVREDVTDIILNVKALVVKLHSPGSKTLRIEKEGPGEVTGYDIVADADVEIVNPEIHIADLDVDARLFMELTVERGQGLRYSRGQQDAGQPIGVIAIDSRFTPVTKVNYSIEATRVGQRTDYDRLVLEISTDGSVRPDERVESAPRSSSSISTCSGVCLTRFATTRKKRFPVRRPKSRRSLRCPLRSLSSL